MIYPVCKTKKEFEEKWYDAQPFGTKTNYGWHESADINLRTGGDSDLGQPLYAIADGEITSVCKTHPTKNFGLHLHLKFETKDGVRWAHYAHCKTISVKEGDKVKEGQKIAELGKSGTTSSHLHFAIKNVPTGIEGIAKTKEDLKKWEDPIAFIERYLESDCVPREEYKELKADYLELYNRWKARDVVFDSLGQQVKDLTEANKDLRANNAKWRADFEELKRQNEALVEEAKLLNAIKNAVSSLFRSKQ